MKRVCSECGKTLRDKGPAAKTCSNRCRAKRSRRTRRAARERQAKLSEAKLLKEHEEIISRASAGPNSKEVEIAHEVMREELRPIAREAITEEVIEALREMMSLAPSVVRQLKTDIDSPDAPVRQKAYDLWLRYTVGNRTIAPKEEEEGKQQLNVHFDLPRPGDTEQPTADEPVIDDAVELRLCATCREDKPESEFVANSDRCIACHDLMKARVQEMLGTP